MMTILWSLALCILDLSSSAHALPSPHHQQCSFSHPLSTPFLQYSSHGKEIVYTHPFDFGFPEKQPSFTIPPSGPWSFPLVCTELLPGVGDKLCVYTSTSFSDGRGISIFTTPSLAAHFLSLPAFTDPSFPSPGINEDSGTWKIHPLPSRGLGLLATRPLSFKDRVTAYTPALLAYLESDLSTSEREKYYKIAVQQLPEVTREMFLGLATVYGVESVKHQDVVKANTFQMEVGGANHLAVFPETSRLNHGCSPK